MRRLYEPGESTMTPAEERAWVRWCEQGQLQIKMNLKPGEYLAELAAAARRAS